MTSPSFDQIVSDLAASYGNGFGVNNAAGKRVPDRASVARLCDLLVHVMFPGFFAGDTYTPLTAEGLRANQDHPSLRRLLADLQDDLYQQLHHAYCFQASCQGTVDNKATAAILDRVLPSFMQELSPTRRILAGDVAAAYENDPAATGMEEILVSYPCIETIAVQRLAHVLYCLQVPFLPRIMTEVAHSRTGIDIHPGATIGEHFFIDHGTGVVIGETTNIGSHVVLYHGVTLGAFNPTLRNQDGELERGSANKRHPDLEDHVTVYPGATILGGNTRIGHHSVIGGNAWVTHSVEPWSTVTMPEPELRIRQKRQ